MAGESTSTLPIGADDRMLDMLDGMVRSATAPEVFDAQLLLLRRLALQGDHVGSRMPAPRNITEVGGYINLLGTLKQPELQAQVIAATLGMPGAQLPFAGIYRKPPLALLTLPNDRPEIPAQPGIPLTFCVRSDFAPAIQAALQKLHDRGCALPFLTSALPLPQTLPEPLLPYQLLAYLGRTLEVVPGCALLDPITDPLALARIQSTPVPFGLVARVLPNVPAPVPVPGDNWEVLRCDASHCTIAPMNGNRYVPVTPILAAAGFYPALPPAAPVNLADTAWAQFVNTTGLVVGKSRLGDELDRIYSTAEILFSAFASRLDWVWDGKKFAPI